jgi:four helix bundle protein
MNEYQESLKKKMDEYVHLVYGATKSFPKEEMFGSTSQLRRASLSVVLNYIEGYARRKPLVRLNFLETSYGSLQESKYLIEFVFTEKFLTLEQHSTLSKLANAIGAMLWKEIENLSTSSEKH